MWDAVVVGLGGVGAFALRALSKESKKVLGIEKFRRCHPYGSSHGQSRIYRKAYFEDPQYVPWIEFALEEFRQLEQDFGESIIQQCGMLLADEDGSLIDVSKESAKQHNVNIETMNVIELRHRFPQFKFTDKMVGVFEPEAGFLRPEKAMRLALADAENGGAEILEETSVKAIHERSDGSFEIIAADIAGDLFSIESRSVVISAGSWTSQLVPYLRKHLKVIRQLQMWVDTSNFEQPTIFESPTMPAFVLASEAWPLPLYGVPADSQSENSRYSSCVKIGVHGRPIHVDPDNNPFTVTPGEEDEMRGVALLAFANPESESIDFKGGEPCMYTMSPDDNFMIGVPPGYQGLFVVAGLSGHGFKMAPALGQMMADHALAKDMAAWRTNQFCGIRRFDRSSYGV